MRSSKSVQLFFAFLAYTTTSTPLPLIPRASNPIYSDPAIYLSVTNLTLTTATVGRPSVVNLTLFDPLTNNPANGTPCSVQFDGSLDPLKTLPTPSYTRCSNATDNGWAVQISRKTCTSPPSSSPAPAVLSVDILHLFHASGNGASEQVVFKNASLTLDPSLSTTNNTICDSSSSVGIPAYADWMCVYSVFEKMRVDADMQMRADNAQEIVTQRFGSAVWPPASGVQTRAGTKRSKVTLSEKFGLCSIQGCIYKDE